MLCVNKYPKTYVDRCRSNLESQLGAYKALVSSAGAKTGAKESAFKSAVDAFEQLFFNNLVVVLDSYFVHRSRTIEKRMEIPSMKCGCCVIPSSKAAE